MKKPLILVAAILAMIVVVSCEKECPECVECEKCELEHLGLNSEWGEKVKADLTSLFFEIEDLALLRVYNNSGDVCHWSGFDAGNAMEDSRQIQVDFLETELILIWKRYVEGKWTHSMISINYDDITSAILQNVTFIKGGQVVRRANNVLIFISDDLNPVETDGAIANAVAPEGLKEISLQEIFRK